MTDTPEQTIIYILKQVVMAIDHTMETGYTAKLNFRIGTLKFANSKFYFINSEGKANQFDQVSKATSCNTEYRVNKRYLTNLRERPTDHD